jgi:hypothetical protein
MNTAASITRAGYVGDKRNKSKQLHLRPCSNVLHLLFGVMLSKYIESVKDKRSCILVGVFIYLFIYLFI